MATEGTSPLLGGNRPSFNRGHWSRKHSNSISLNHSFPTKQLINVAMLQLHQGQAIKRPYCMAEMGRWPTSRDTGRAIRVSAPTDAKSREASALNCFLRLGEASVGSVTLRQYLNPGARIVVLPQRLGQLVGALSGICHEKRASPTIRGDPNDIAMREVDCPLRGTCRYLSGKG